MAHPQHNPSHHSPSDKDAEIIQFVAPRGAEELDPYELSLAECVSFFIHKWNHPSYSDRPIAEAINRDANVADGDEWQKRLEQAVNASPLFDHYDELLEADPVTRLLDSVMRSSIPARGSMTDERKAISTIMYMRGTEVLEEGEGDISLLLAKLPFGDEQLWITLAQRLASEQ